MRADAVVRIHRFRLLRIKRGRVDADQAHTVSREQIDGLRRDGAKRAVPAVLRRVRVGAQQHTRRDALQRAFHMLGQHERRGAYAMNHAARADVRIERHRADRRAFGVVMQRRVGVRARVWRKRHARDVDRRAGLHAPHALDANGRIARPDGRSGLNRRGNVLDLCHRSGVSSPDASNDRQPYAKCACEKSAANLVCWHIICLKTGMETKYERNLA